MNKNLKAFVYVDGKPMSATVKISRVKRWLWLPYFLTRVPLFRRELVTVSWAKPLPAGATASFSVGHWSEKVDSNTETC